MRKIVVSELVTLDGAMEARALDFGIVVPTDRAAPEKGEGSAQDE